MLVYLVVVKIELVADTEPVTTLLAGEALQVVDVGPGSHHHLKGRDHLQEGGVKQRNKLGKRKENQ